MLSRSAMAATLPLMEIRLQPFPSNQIRAALRQFPHAQTVSKEFHMTTQTKTVIVTGASQGIGSGIANEFLARGYNVVANSRNISRRNELQRSNKLVLV